MAISLRYLLLLKNSNHLLRSQLFHLSTHLHPLLSLKLHPLLPNHLQKLNPFRIFLLLRCLVSLDILLCYLTQRLLVHSLSQFKPAMRM